MTTGTAASLVVTAGVTGATGPTGGTWAGAFTNEIVWTITHALPFWPSVTQVDQGGSLIFGTVDFVSATEIQVTHSTARSGSIFLS